MIGAALVGTIISACSASSAPAAVATHGGWVEQAVTFAAGGVTVHGTYRHPTRTAAASPGALLIAGSGPTDRNGNQAQATHQDTLRTLATWLSLDGVPSLRYDKLGSGETGLGPAAANPATIGVEPFEQEAAAALGVLASQPGIDRTRLLVVGHSEGTLFAQLLAAGMSGPAPAVRALALLEPLSMRYLDLIAEQIDTQVTAAQQSGRFTADQAAQYRSAVANAIGSLRSSGVLPSGLPESLAAVFDPASLVFLREADRIDPLQLASSSHAGPPVLVSCSDADDQVSCTDVDRLVAALRQDGAVTDFVRLTGVDHLLKEDPSGSSANYDAPLPFSRQLQQALHDFVAAHG